MADTSLLLQVLAIMQAMHSQTSSNNKDGIIASLKQMSVLANSALGKQAIAAAAGFQAIVSSHLVSNTLVERATGV